MSLLWFDGFEGYSGKGNSVLTTQMTERGWVVDTTFTFPVHAAGRYDSANRLGGLELTFESSAGFGIKITTPANYGNRATLAFGFYFNIKYIISTNGWKDTKLAVLFKGATEQLALKIRFNKSLNEFYFEVVRGATVLATSKKFKSNTSQATAGNTWRQLEFKATIHTSAGAYELRIDGVPVVKGSAVNTANGASNDADRVLLESPGFAQGGSHGFHIDDFYLAEDFLGPIVTERQFACRNGSPQEFAKVGLVVTQQHYHVVNDRDLFFVEGHDTDISYVKTDQDGKKEFFKLSKSRLIRGGIKAVNMIATERLESAGSKTTRLNVKSPAGTESLGAGHTVNSTTYKQFIETRETDPATGRPWVPDSLENGQAGVEFVT